MTGHEFAGAIAKLREKVARQQLELSDTKRAVNMLCREAGLESAYIDVEQPEQDGQLRIKRDQFYGKRLATAIREYLEARKKCGLGPAKIDEIFAALTSGAYEFESKKEVYAKRGLAIALAKNTVTFRKLPNSDVFGLVTWYPAAKTPNGRPPKQAENEDDSTVEEKPKEKTATT